MKIKNVIGDISKGVFENLQCGTSVNVQVEEVVRAKRSEVRAFARVNSDES